MSLGILINFILVDSPKLGNMLKYCPFILVYPIQIGIYITMLFYYLGISFLFGMIPLVLFIVVNFFMYSKYSEMESDFLARKDWRMKATTETFDALKLLKMYAWEEEFRKKVNFIFYIVLTIKKIILFIWHQIF